MTSASGAVALAIGAAACGGGDGAARATMPDNQAVPTVRELALAVGTQLRVYRIAGGRVELERAVDLPSAVGTLAWAGADPVVMLMVNAFEDTGIGDPAHDYEIGRVGARFERYALPPVSTWDAPPPAGADSGMIEHVADRPSWSLVVTEAGDVWAGRSEWYFVPDAGGYTNWVYARLAPAPVVATRDEPAGSTPPALPAIAAPAASSLDAALVPLAGAPRKHVLRCTTHGATTEYPPADARDGLIDVDALVWLSTTPPRFRIDTVWEGMTSFTRHEIFEGCETMPEAPVAVAGPDALVAIAERSSTIVVQGGAVIATLPGASLAAFRP